MPELSRYLFLAGALPFLFLGIAHALATPRSTSESKGLSPRDPALRDAMARETVLLTRRTNLWLAWVGFNLSHGLGAVLFGAVVALSGRSQASFQADGPLFLPLAVLVCGLYLVLGIRYWFRTPIIGIALSGACFVLSWVLFAISGHVIPPANGVSSLAPSPDTALRDSDELKRLRDDDQGDRAPEVIDWTVVTPRDRARLRRVKELFAADGLHTANDYLRSALVLQHGEAADDFLLAHEFCVAAMVLGRNDRESASLAAGAEDRFLMNIGRPQRFGAQFKKDGAGPWYLYTVGDGVTDALRRLMGEPSLAEAKAHEAEMNGESDKLERHRR